MSSALHISASVIKSAARRFASFVVPPSCAGCGALVQQAQALCPQCWPKLSFISAPFCDKYATPFAVAGNDNTLSPEAYRYPPVWAHARAAVLFKGLAPDLLHALKYSDRQDIAPVMGRLMAQAGRDIIEASDFICPVPLHWRRMLSRRYNQANVLAQQVATLSGKPCRAQFLKHDKFTRSQVGLSREARIKNMRGVFTVPTQQKPQIKGRTILLVDDVMTSGATLNAAARTLIKGGAREVNVLVFARVTEILE